MAKDKKPNHQRLLMLFSIFLTTALIGFIAYVGYLKLISSLNNESSTQTVEELEYINDSAAKTEAQVLPSNNQE